MVKNNLYGLFQDQVWIRIFVSLVLGERGKIWGNSLAYRGIRRTLHKPHFAKGDWLWTKIPNPEKCFHIASWLTSTMPEYRICVDLFGVSFSLLLIHISFVQCPSLSAWNWLSNLTARVDGTPMFQRTDGLDLPTLQTNDKCWHRCKFSVLMSLLKVLSKLYPDRIILLQCDLHRTFDSFCAKVGKHCLWKGFLQNFLLS